MTRWTLMAVGIGVGVAASVAAAAGNASASTASTVTDGSEQPVRTLYINQRSAVPRWIRVFDEPDVPVPVVSSAASAPAPPRVFLLAGKIEQTFDSGPTQVDAVIMPTNSALDFDSGFPMTQKALMARVRRDAEAKANLTAKVRSRTSRQLTIATEVLPVEFWSPTTAPSASKPGSMRQVPRYACLIATDEPIGGAGRMRDLFTQQKVRVGVAKCLGELDALGVRSVALPLVGAASNWSVGPPGSERDFRFKQCRMINSIAGIGLGIASFLPTRLNIQEIGIVQWTDDLESQYPERAGQASAERVAFYGGRAMDALRSSLKGITVDLKALDYEPDCNALYRRNPDGPSKK